MNLSFVLSIPVVQRSQYLNACNTFKALLDLNVLPVVNENDSVCNHEIRFGDNDTLSAISAGMVNADFLFLLTDVDALYTSNPNNDPNAKPLRYVEDINALREKVDVSQSGTNLGTGGMVTKLVAAVRTSTLTLITPQSLITHTFIHLFTPYCRLQNRTLRVRLDVQR